MIATWRKLHSTRHRSLRSPMHLLHTAIKRRVARVKWVRSASLARGAWEMHIETKPLAHACPPSALITACSGEAHRSRACARVGEEKGARTRRRDRGKRSRESLSLPLFRNLAVHQSSTTLPAATGVKMSLHRSLYSIICRPSIGIATIPDILAERGVDRNDTQEPADRILSGSQGAGLLSSPFSGSYSKICVQQCGGALAEQSLKETRKFSFRRHLSSSRILL